MMNISGILLAAGMSTRMGQPKQLLPFGRSTVIETVIETLLASQLVEVMVVLGHQRQQIYQQI
jgi:molybdenum cofactor cytidylyltransferase